MNEGQVVQVIGPVLDIDFAAGALPSILNAIRVPRTNADGRSRLRGSAAFG
jgi:F-type H+/Na+-transporting ATPase subunit beta